MAALPADSNVGGAARPHISLVQSPHTKLQAILQSRSDLRIENVASFADVPYNIGVEGLNTYYYNGPSMAIYNIARDVAFQGRILPI